jgi:hypothetical protein
LFLEPRDVKHIYVGPGVMALVTIPRTEEDGVTCRGEKCAERSHQPAALVLIAEVGRNDAENEGACVRRYLVMTCKHGVTPRRLK